MRNAHGVVASSLAFLVALLTGTGCSSCTPAPQPLPEGAIQPDLWCPGGPSCPASDAPTFSAGAAARDITPPGFEIAKVAFLSDRDGQECLAAMEQQFGLRRCGTLHLNFQRNCGNDQICPDNIGSNLESGAQASDGLDNDRDGLVDDAEVAYAGPDADGSEGDLNPDGTPRLDFFHDCGLDRLCPGNAPESGAQASDGIDNDGDGAVDGEDVAYPGPDGGEGDGKFQGIWLAGFDNNRPAVGIHDRLTARAIALRSGETTLVLVAIDAVGLFFDEVERARALLEQRLPGAVDYLLVASSHDHEAPDLMGQWGMADPAVSDDISDEPGRLDGYNAFVVAQLVDAAVEAVGSLRPAQLHLAATRTGIAAFQLDDEDPLIYDDAMLVVRVAAAQDDATIATLLNWPQHPESLWDRNNFVSADFPDAMRRAIEQGLPAGPSAAALPGTGGIAMYLNGLVGGMVGPNFFDFTGRDGTLYQDPGGAVERTFARTQAYGENVAAVALTALQQAELVLSPRLSVRAHRLEIPVDNVLFHFAIMRGIFDRQISGWDRSAVTSVGNRPHLRSEVAVLELGPISFITMPGEGFPELAFGGYDGSHTPGGPTAMTKASNPNPPDVSKAPGPPYLYDYLDAKYEFAIGLANDEIGYIIPPWRFELSDNPWVDEPPGEHYCETNSVSIEAAPMIDAMLRGLTLFPLP